jgi:glycosyltransferase involved in cell wall biosynthesis
MDGWRITKHTGFAMHIVNVMFSRIAGGVEQAFVDYCEAQMRRGHRVTAILYPGAWVHPMIQALGIEVIPLRNFNEWDLIATFRLRKLVQGLNPDIVIGHSNRAFAHCRRAVKGKFPLVGITHNYSTKRLSDADAVFATTNHLIAHIAKQGVAENRIFHIPNMVRCHELPKHQGKRNSPPLIGTMGRFVAKKGFDVYIDALRILKGRGKKFTATLGGEGAEGKRLMAQAAGLTDILTFPGWIRDKKAFYSQIDIFCLPSLHEPFGIVLLEAFVYGAPVVSTDSEGPLDIITPNYDAILVKKGDAEAMANALEKLLDDANFANDLATNAFVKAKSRYEIDVVGKRIEDALNIILERWNKN